MNVQVFFKGSHRAEIRPHSKCPITVFFPQFKRFFPNYICIALNTDTENKIVMIK